MERAAARYMESVRGDPLLLHDFLVRMPKGGDLHSHLSGAVYAESFIRWAAEDGLCIVTATLAAARPPCDTTAGRVPASTAFRNMSLYGDLIDAWSMRNWNPARENGHDHFFATFGRFSMAGRTGDMLAEVSSRAAEQNTWYLELMLTPDAGKASALGAATGWNPNLDSLRLRLIAAGLRDTVARGLASLDAAETRRRALQKCGEPARDTGCDVTVRYLYQVARAQPLAQVFAQILAGFESATADRRVVGLNLVQPEDYPLAMEDYRRHMEIIAHLKKFYPSVRVTLHAGELAEGLVPPEGLRFHINDAVNIAGASRIGHGVDVLYESRPFDLLRTMAARSVLVEIALTSNDVILGVRGRSHPLAAYLAHGVPFALVTDDEGVSRSSLTREYRRAVEDQGLDYSALKRSARNALSYSFVEGESVWTTGTPARPVTECTPARGGWKGASCSAIANRSVKARLQLQLEAAFERFESGFMSR